MVNCPLSVQEQIYQFWRGCQVKSHLDANGDANGTGLEVKLLNRCGCAFPTSCCPTCADLC